MIQLTQKKTNKDNVLITLPASKSISNRYLILKALSQKKYPIHNLSRAHDTQLLRQLLHKKHKIYNVKDTGTAFRFLMPLLSNTEGTSRITGTTRLMNRPIKPLIKALNRLGVSIIDESDQIIIKGHKINKSITSINQSESSQFASALMLSGASFKNGLHLRLTGKSVSGAYLDLTTEALTRAGISFKLDEHWFIVGHQRIQLPECRVENDWSSAAYFYQVMALSACKTLTLYDLNPKSIQADAIMISLFKQLGVSTKSKGKNLILGRKAIKLSAPLEFNCMNYPDLVPSLVVTCAALGIDATFRQIGHLRFKESDRILALQENLAACGVRFRIYKHTIQIKSNGIRDQFIGVKTYNDHRIAMAFAPLCFLNNNVLIDQETCVQKSFPDFWKQLKKTGVQLHEC